MTSEQKLKSLRDILKAQIDWYKTSSAREKTGEVDSSYVYDQAIDQFDDLSRGDFCSILSILAKEEE